MTPTNKKEVKRPRSDEDELSVCSALIKKLNSEREEWDQPVRVAHAKYFDWECVHLRDRNKKLMIQVARTGSLWKQLGKEDAVHEDGAAVERLADSMMAVIRHNMAKSGYSHNVVLVIDASNAPRNTLTAVVRVFCKRHGASAILAGFKEIWLVGPDSATTHCLMR